MRTLLAALLSWFFPPRGTRRAQAVPTQNTPADSPTQTLGVVRPRSPRQPEYLRGEDIPLIRPYLIAYEREQERRRQKDRRTALVLATQGIDFPTLDFHGVAS
ncbi:hypothetical protein AB0H18_10705 [Streptomyces sp. NPDC020766]|uniref:hypothetical protein n=1 Tax=Streptomyces sp. NPDC020766 TaxID=3155011 RepID=UPI0033EFFC8A